MGNRTNRGWRIAALTVLLLVPASVAVAGGEKTWSVELLVKTGDTISTREITGLPGNGVFSIASDGRIPFEGQFSGGSGIFTQDGLLVKTGDSVGGKTLTVTTTPNLSPGGTLVFLGYFSENGVSKRAT